MTDKFDLAKLLHSTNDAGRAMVRQGFAIGRREAGLIYRPLIKEFCYMLDALAPTGGVDREDAEELIARAKKVMDDA